MMEWRIGEALAVDTSEAVTRWWAHRRPSPAAPIPAGLVEDLQTARLALDDGLQRRLWELAGFLKEPQRAALMDKITELDPWHVLWDMTEPDRVLAAQEATGEDDQGLVAALRERARRREKLPRPNFPSKMRRRLRDLACGRGGLAAVLGDKDACRMLRFGAMLCDLVEIDPGEQAEPDPGKVRASLAGLTRAEAQRAAEAVLNHPLLGTDDRGRPVDSEIKRFVHDVLAAVERRTEHRLTPTISRFAARSPNWDDLPGPDIELVRDLLACHAPRSVEAIADLIKGA